MGNGVILKMIKCCNSNKDLKNGDINIENNLIISYKLNNQNINKEEIQNRNDQNVVTTKHSSGSLSLNKGKKNFSGDNNSNKEPNVSICYNTFKLSNSNLIKNNLVQNNINKNNKYFPNNPLDELRLKDSTINNNNIDIKTKLILTGELFSNKSIEIDKFGMKNGLRQKNDGVTIFGFKLDNNNSNISSYDYLLDIKFEKITKSHKKRNLGKVFEIILDRREKVYILYYRHNSLLLYYQINDSLYFEVDKDYFLILGDIFISITVRRTMNTNEKRINFRVEVENEKPKKYSYEQKDVPIKIGRADCHINIPNPSISKLHSIIDFANDMFYYNDKKSTNGSILLLKEDDILKIKGEMNFKLEDIPFKIKEIIIDEK